MVEELISQQVVIGEVELPSGVPERVLVAFTREVKPLGVTKLIALEIEITFATEGVCEQSDHLVQRHSSSNDRRQRGEGGHVCVHLCVAEVENQGLVTDQAVKASVKHVARCSSEQRC